MAQGKKKAVNRSKPKAKPTKSKSKRANVSKSQGPGLSDVGHAVGAYLGGPIGAAIGGFGGNILSKITGFGTYHVNKNSVSEGNMVPSFYSEGNGTVLAHREFIADVTGSVAFTTTTYDVNPGIPTTFPWLSQIANNFEQYEMLGLVFEYRPTSGAYNAASSAFGTVLMATNYDANDPVFTTKVGMEAYEYSTSCAPFDGALHPIECDPKTRPVNITYCRSMPTLSGDLTAYDLGKFTVATQGQPAAYICGELWVTYHVRFLKPKAHVLGTYAHFCEFPKGSGGCPAPTASTGISMFGNTGTAYSTAKTISNAVPGCSMDYDYTNGSRLLLATPGYYRIDLRLAPLGASPNMTTPPAFRLPGGYAANITNMPVEKDGASSYSQAQSGTNGSVTTVVQVTASGTGTANMYCFEGGVDMTFNSADLWVFYLGVTRPLAPYP